MEYPFWEQIIDRITETFSLECHGRNEKVEKLRSVCGVPVVVERRGTEFVNLWLPRLQGIESLPNAQRYGIGRTRNSNLPPELSRKNEAWKVAVEDGESLRRIVVFLRSAGFGDAKPTA